MFMCTEKTSERFDSNDKRRVCAQERGRDITLLSWVPPSEYSHDDTGDGKEPFVGEGRERLTLRSVPCEWRFEGQSRTIQ